ncbi:hypothetical protein A2936_00130 [Candidatus Uhrbacteria bacterium RIFCSPLOWO2_01_FULL_47_25]|uniref:Uncharacterized protein n=1 Tax=Candidatus Uhrbacteria bacterium RIFCSPLOWO2_01_FULL_47_25 TaxID=1802402 RepID=A0A1F7UT84_9BACT|nr:MAG: hypothetical protein UX68_C0023G0008 [Parcubacteria group bacterium GW2011_GWA2_46_9]OGL81475.1 MAG: hypothetical protein A2936_00130 [Candidatus Uhrbacteria bacterium RIFCSPLOWO2_01_FULL_47_25]
MPETRVILHFLRHEDKETVVEKPDTDIELKESGRVAAFERGLKEPAHLEVSWAAGSNRIRALHTALLRMAAGTGSVTAEMSYAEAKASVEAEMKYGEKVVSMPELNFNFSGSKAFEAEAMGSYKAGRGLEYLLRDSDRRVVELGDKDSFSYSRVAANYASLISREMQVGNNFNKLVKQKPDKYAEFDNKLERYFGTHQTVPECFYMKVLEKFQGRAAAEKFIDKLRDKDGKVFGFDFQEGIDIIVTNGANGQSIVIKNMRGLPDVALTPELLADIIRDAERLDKTIDKDSKAIND